MIIGVPKEIKKHEYRVGLTPQHMLSYIKAGHTVYVQKGAGDGAGYPDNEYLQCGAKILDTIEEIYAISDMIIKVKEPLEPEYKLMREGQILYTYFHLAASKEILVSMIQKKKRAMSIRLQKAG